MDHKELKIGSKKFIIHDPVNLPILRFAEYQKQSLQLAYNSSFQSLYSNVTQVIELNQDEADTREIDLALKVIQNGLLETSKERYDHAMYVCTYFICTKKEDLSKVPTPKEQEYKLKLWNDAGIPAGFFLNSWIAFNPQFKSLFLSLMGKKMKEVIQCTESIDLLLRGRIST